MPRSDRISYRRTVGSESAPPPSRRSVAFCANVSHSHFRGERVCATCFVNFPRANPTSRDRRSLDRFIYASRYANTPSGFDSVGMNCARVGFSEVSGRRMLRGVNTSPVSRSHALPAPGGGGFSPPAVAGNCRRSLDPSPDAGALSRGPYLPLQCRGGIQATWYRNDPLRRYPGFYSASEGQVSEAISPENFMRS